MVVVDSALTMDPALLLALRSSFALLLGTAAWHKLSDTARYRAVVESYEVLPSAAVAVAAPLLAAAETSLALMLAAGIALPAAAASAAALMLVYAAALQVNVRRGRRGLDCGCAGPAAHVPVSGALVLRNLVLAAAALLGALPSSGRALSWVDFASAAAATAALSACWLASERMLALAPRVAELRSRRRPS